MFRRVLVPVDFARKNVRAVKVAAKMASQRGAALTLLHVIERVDAGDDGALAGFYRELEKNAREKMGALLASAGRVPAHAEILYGNRVTEILRFAAEDKTDLIVMDSHRVALKHPGENWGTISYKIGILARCPVLLVK
jgi:nucleotide-binding universal stress UspA family protein